MRQVEWAGSAKGSLPTKEAVPELYLFLATIAVHIVSREAGKKVQNTTRVVSDASFDAGQPRRHVKESDYCKRMSEDSKDGSLAEDDFLKGTVKNRTSSSVF